ncbi:MAG: gephyrin-like molybdotransferase Glp [Pseudomonadota bacterium]
MIKRQLRDDCFVHDRDRMRHDEVLSLLAERLVQTVGAETIALGMAAGRIIDQDIMAPITVPQSDNAAVDGYAFAHTDYLAADGQLTLGETASAGRQRIDLAAGQAVRIFTGAVMPNGADSVAMQEDCRVEGPNVKIPAGLKRGANCRLAGEDVKTGERLIPQGHILSPAHIAALASVGIDQVPVRARLRVGILSTGDEIVQPGATAAPHQVFDANRPMLSALLQDAKINLVDLGHLGDDREKLQQTIEAAAANLDLIITSGGASRGGEDHMLDILDQLGNRHLWQIAVKPGRPIMFGQIGDCVLIGLPGNPVAAFVCTLAYVRPTMAHLMGTRPRRPRPLLLPAAFAIEKKKPDRREFARGWRNKDGSVDKFARDGSGLIAGLTAAGGLIELPEATTSVAKGDLVRFIPFDEFAIAHEDQP